MFRVLYQKELMVASRNMKTPVCVFAVNVILAFVAIFTYYLGFITKKNLGQTAQGEQILWIYTFLCLILFGIVVVSMIVLTVHCVLDERRNHSLDVLIATGVSPMSYLLSKLLARVVIVMVVVLSSAPILGIVFFVGGISLSNFITMYLMLLVTAFFIGAISLFCSTYCNGNVTSTICTFLMVFLVIVGTLILVSICYLYRKVELGVSIDDMTAEITLGKLTYVLLINPLYTFLQLFRRQLGLMNDLLQYIEGYDGDIMLYRSWIVNSCLVQFGASFVFIVLSKLRFKQKKYSKRAIFK